MRVQSRSPVLKGQVANGEDRFWQGPKWNDGYAFGNEDQRGVLAISFMRSLARGWRPAPVLSKSLHFLQPLHLIMLCCAVVASFLHNLRFKQKTRENHLPPPKCLLKN